MMKYSIVFIILCITITLFPINVKASRGCCSHHGGIDYCGSNGYYICNDGTQSPTCTCSSTSQSITSNDDGICLATYNDVVTLENEVEELNKTIDKLNDQLETEKIKTADYKTYFYLILISFIIYFIYKNSEKKG